MSNIKDLRISQLVRELDAIKKQMSAIDDAVRKLNQNDEYVARFFTLIQEKHNGLKDVLLKTITKVSQLECDIQKITSDAAPKAPDDQS
jgi:hypothetical protein